MAVQPGWVSRPNPETHIPRVGETFFKKMARERRYSGRSFVIRVKGRKRNTTMRLTNLLTPEPNGDDRVISREQLLADMLTYNEELVRAGMMLASGMLDAVAASAARQRPESLGTFVATTPVC